MVSTHGAREYSSLAASGESPNHGAFLTSPRLINSSSELFLIIICGSVPSLRPLYDTISKGKPLRPNKPSHFNNSDSGGSNGFRLGSSTSQQGYSSAKGTNTTRVTTNGMSSSNSRVDAHHVINPERGYDINVMLNKEPVRANEYNIV